MGARVSRSRVGHTVTATHVLNRLGRMWLMGVRVSHGRPDHGATLTHVLGRVWLEHVPGCRGVALVTQSPPQTCEVG